MNPQTRETLGPQRTDAFTYITQADGQTKQLYSALFWCEISLFLETAGPVSVGFRPSLGSVLSGTGILLPSGGPQLSFKMRIGDILYVTSQTVNRVKVSIAPILLQETTEILNASVQSTPMTIGNIIRSILGKPQIAPEPPKPICPPKLRVPRF